MSSKNYFISAALLVASGMAVASTEVIETSSYADITAKLAQELKQYPVDKTLLVLDIDNTILTSSVDLGGDIWYQWQRGKLDVKPTDEQKVACLFEDSIGLLYELNPQVLTEESVPSLVSQWQKDGYTMFALTSRSPKYRAATERELLSKGIDFDVTALAPQGEETPVYREVTKRELSYSKGVMMTTGMNKGTMLQHILDKTGRSFDKIVFIDDSAKNIKNVDAAYKDSKDVDVSLFHYTRIEEQRKEKFGSVLTQAQADKMAADWAQLNATLNSVFPARDSGKCLSVN
ncbi:DUF2608 domain-containing protein [Agarivorans gilvus]|jgi:hypothetical protein|uniref:DUF2608 domain-containing protein n=1 Tax=Agarivorans gilvus TaxID=680279 RepID=A0ABQ1I6E1_9ALTE|nr:DUF2608 domain-containing protein [Agarivorans gilvus]GGB19868.1 hypothetical protein GCM10007414_36580 [Agarivorans gilvus]